MKYIKTLEEIELAVNRLKQNKKSCAQYNYFCLDNHQHIDIMIDVIANQRTEDWIYATFTSRNERGEEDSQEHAKWGAAINARDYLQGDLKLEDLLYPEH